MIMTAARCYKYAFGHLSAPAAFSAGTQCRRLKHALNGMPAGNPDIDVRAVSMRMVDGSVLRYIDSPPTVFCIVSMFYISGKNSLSECNPLLKSKATDRRVGDTVSIRHRHSDLLPHPVFFLLYTEPFTDQSHVDCRPVYHFKKDLPAAFLLFSISDTSRSITASLQCS